METYKTQGGQPSARDQKRFVLDQNSIEPQIKDIESVYAYIIIK